jgi:hypothetical protein
MNIKISVCIPPEVYMALLDEQLIRRKTGVDKNGKRAKCTMSAIVSEWLYRGCGRLKTK